MKIYKIVSVDDWRQAQPAGLFSGAAIDLEDGYIHFSAAGQVAETAAKHFSGQADLLLITVEADDLGDDLRWEPSRGGDLFPHLYSPLDLSDVESASEIPVDENGVHRLHFRSSGST